jgi:putative ABC transport system permease protein
LFKNYLKIAYRNIKKNAGHTLINITGLSVGITAFIMIFLFVGFEKSYDSFHDNKERIFRVRNDRIYKDIHDRSAGCPPAVGPAMLKDYSEVEAYARVQNANWTNPVLSYHPGSSRPPITFNQPFFYADGAFLKMFSFPMIDGNNTALDEPDTAVVTAELAKKIFGPDSPVGKVVTLTSSMGERQIKVTGIMENIPANSHIRFDMLVSYKTLVSINKDAEYYWGWNAFNTYVLLKPGTDWRELEAKLPGMVSKYKNGGADFKRRYLLQPLTSIHLHSHLRFEPGPNGSARTVNFLIIIAFFILIVSWVNFVNLTTARSILRAKEVGIRKVLGSGRGQLVKQFFFESASLNGFALMFAVIIVYDVLPYFSRFVQRPLEISSMSPMAGWLILAFLVGIVVTAIYPAFVLSSFKAVTVLKGRFTNTRRGIKFRKFLVILQFVISTILIVSTATVYKQLAFMENRDLGFQVNNIMIIKTPASSGYDNMKKERLRNEFSRLPFIKNMTVSDSVPGKDYNNASSGIRRQESGPEKGKRCFFINIEHNYFKFYGIPLVAGRYFSPTYSGDRDSILINQEAVKLLGFDSPNDALQKIIVLGGLEGIRKTVVGVTEDYHHKSLKSPVQAVIYLPGAGKYYSLKVDGLDTEGNRARVEKIWKSAFGDVPFDYYYLEENFNNQYRPERQFRDVFILFSVLTVIISCLGFFSLVSFTARQRTREIAIRKVLGASASGIVVLLSREILVMIAVSLLVAWPCSYYIMNRWLENFAFRTTIGLPVFLLSGVIIVLVAFCTTIYQALKAAYTNPAQAIRFE